MLSLYALGLLIAGCFTGVGIVVSIAPKSVKQKFNKYLWEGNTDE